MFKPKPGVRCSYNEWMSCKRKKAYDNLSKLRKAGKKMEKFYGGCIDVHGYFCHICGKFHITTRKVTSDELKRSNDLVF